MALVPRRLLLLLVLLRFTMGPASVTAAQDAIRVETNQVLVPAVVLDLRLYEQLDKEISKHQPVSEDSPLLQQIPIRNLTAKDFQLLEDGHKQRIENVRLETPAFSIVKDNKGKHPEILGEGGGRWEYPDLPDTDRTLWLSLPQYVIAYVPPASPPGSCHQIKVLVGRAKAIVWARSEYCNTKHPPSDPLKGTEFGKQLESDLRSAKESQIDLKLQAVTFYNDAGMARLNIELEFPGQTLKHVFRNGTLYASIGALIMVYNKDGTLAARSSEFACCDYGNGIKTPRNLQTFGDRSGPFVSIIPNRYETQIELPPGEYEVRVILSDGEKYGRTQMPLTVESYDGKQLGLSEIALCRRVRVMPAGSPESQAEPVGRYLPLVSKGIEFTPTGNPHFEKKGLLYAYFEIYRPQAAQLPATTIEAHLKILDAKTSEVKIDFAPVNTAAYVKADSSVIGVGRGLNITGLPDGSYRLEVQATDSTGKSTGWHTAKFTVQSESEFSIPNQIPGQPTE